MKRSALVPLSLILALVLSLSGCAKGENSAEKANPASDFEYAKHDTDGYIAIVNYIGSDKTVVIPDEIEELPVKAISVCAFMNTDIESVDIPDTVKMISDNAFTNCQELHTVNMGNGVMQVGYEAFKNCTSLKNLTLSSSLSNIGVRAFKDCDSLQSIFIPKSVTEWGMEAFYSCPLTSLTFEDGIENIGSYACFWTGGTLKSITFPSSVTALGEYSFSEGLDEVRFEGNAPTKMGAEPFHEDTVIYYNKDTSGWDDTLLNDYYTLKAK